MSESSKESADNRELLRYNNRVYRLKGLINMQWSSYCYEKCAYQLPPNLGSYDQQCISECNKWLDSFTTCAAVGCAKTFEKIEFANDKPGKYDFYYLKNKIDELTFWRDLEKCASKYI